MAAKDYSHLSWNPRILEHGPNYDDPFICPSRPKDDDQIVKSVSYRFGTGRRVFVSSYSGSVVYDSIRKALAVVAAKDACSKRDMFNLRRICARHGLTCGYAEDQCEK